jgi:hypothetical protein
MCIVVARLLFFDDVRALSRRLRDAIFVACIRCAPRFGRFRDGCAIAVVA